MATKHQIERGKKIIAEYRDCIRLADETESEIKSGGKMVYLSKRLANAEYRLEKLDEQCTALAMTMGQAAWDNLFPDSAPGMKEIICYAELRKDYLKRVNNGLPYPPVQ